MMKDPNYLDSLELIGKDSSKLIFEDDLTGVYNRRFLLHYFQHKAAWKDLEKHPLSLIMLDVDHFKQVNDTYGHQVGDQALTWVARLLKDAAGEDGLAIRYAGDEFMILLPDSDKETAIDAGERLLEMTHKEQFLPDESDNALSITFSIGIAIAPRDAKNGKNLIQKADTALYYAKKAGRDRLANAGEIIPETVFEKTAVYQLEGAKVAGRERQLAKVDAALKNFSRRQSQFLIVEGAAGMGKSEFLVMTRQYVSMGKIRKVQVSGVPQELFTPYYLTASILVAIMNQLPDKGDKVLESLSQKSAAHLARILPQLGLEVEALQFEDERTQREGIFNTLANFIPKILDSRPLILLIDDLHFGDEATLLLFRRLIKQGDIPLFICSTSMETKEPKAKEDMVPLDRFYAAHQQELNIQKLGLTALTDKDIANHIRKLFPDVSLPENFDKELAQISQGNPLFLNEILRKLVLDEKISLKSQQWVIEPIEEEGYLPRSLEEIVSQKIAALDEENRQLLDQFSIIGEDVPLSVLVGSSNKMETEVLEFVDQAANQGLISRDFQLNDETLSFLGKSILEFTYQAIQPDRKQKLHENFGHYQEGLQANNLLPSTATLAYHFKRSADQEAAMKYEQLQIALNSSIFNAREAVLYSDESEGDGPEPATPLDPDSQSKIPKVIRHLLSSLRSIQLYPPGSESITRSVQLLKEVIEQILENNEVLRIAQSKKAFLVNDQEIEVNAFQKIADALLKFMGRLDLKSITFHRGASQDELETLLKAFGKIETKMIDQGFWQRFYADHNLTNISLEQVRYTMMKAQHGFAVDGKTTGEVPVGVDSQNLGGDHVLAQEELSQIPDIVRGLMRAARTVKLYPEQSKAISESVEHFMKALQSILNRRPILALGRVRDSLLVNGVRVDTSDFKMLADNFLKILKVTKIKSLTFLPNITVHGLETFIETLGKLSPKMVDSEFWKRFATNHALPGILFNQHLYDVLNEVGGADTLGDPGKGEPDEIPLTMPSGLPAEESPGELLEGGLEPQTVEPVADEIFETFLRAIPVQLGDLLLKDDEKKIEEMIGKLFRGYENRELPIRRQVIDVCKISMEGLTSVFQYRLAKSLTDPLLVALSEEWDPKVLVEITTLLRHFAFNFIQFFEYPRTIRIFSCFQIYRQQLDEPKDDQTKELTKALDIELDQNTRKLLVNDLKTGDPSKQQNAAELLGTLGRESIPILIDIIKQEDEYRLRQVAVRVLKTLGPEAADRLKREIVLEVNAEERLRILDVIDSLTHNLENELVNALGDENLQVRKAAFQLAERLNNEKVVELLMDFARNNEIDIAAAAIRSLGKLKPPKAVGGLHAILVSTERKELLIACCRSLGQIAHPDSIDFLADVLTPKGRFFPRNKHSSMLRTAAAFTLGQISHPRVAEVLAHFVHDKDPRIRQIARNVLTGKSFSRSENDYKTPTSPGPPDRPPLKRVLGTILKKSRNPIHS